MLGIFFHEPGAVFRGLSVLAVGLGEISHPVERVAGFRSLGIIFQDLVEIFLHAGHVVAIVGTESLLQNGDGLGLLGRFLVESQDAVEGLFRLVVFLLGHIDAAQSHENVGLQIAVGEFRQHLLEDFHALGDLALLHAHVGLQIHSLLLKPRERDFRAKFRGFIEVLGFRFRRGVSELDLVDVLFKLVFFGEIGEFLYGLLKEIKRVLITLLLDVALRKAHIALRDERALREFLGELL